MSSDRNLVILTGTLKWPELSFTAATSYPKFRGKLSVRKEAGKAVSHDQIRLCAWGDLAEVLGELPSGTRLKVTGTLTSRSYKSPCSSCSTPFTQYWYEVLVDNFVLV